MSAGGGQWERYIQRFFLFHGGLIIELRSSPGIILLWFQVLTLAAPGPVVHPLSRVTILNTYACIIKACTVLELLRSRSLVQGHILCLELLC